jgi:hypothetical protein
MWKNSRGLNNYRRHCNCTIGFAVSQLSQFFSCCIPAFPVLQLLYPSFPSSSVAVFQLPQFFNCCIPAFPVLQLLYPSFPSSMTVYQESCLMFQTKITYFAGSNSMSLFLYLVRSRCDFGWAFYVLYFFVFGCVWFSIRGSCLSLSLIGDHT